MRIQVHGYDAAVQCFVLTMNDDFDIILGCDCITDNICNLLLSKDCAKISCTAHDDNCHTWPVSAAGQDHLVKCSLIDSEILTNSSHGRQQTLFCIMRGFLALVSVIVIRTPPRMHAMRQSSPSPTACSRQVA